MKKILLSLLVALPVLLLAQNVGIGTTSPLARLHVTDSNVIFSAPYTDGSLPFSVPINGAGTRVMWLPAIGAFRAGTVSGNYWNRDSIGIYSFASGIDTRALGLASTAMGQGSVATATWSTAIGLNDTAAAFETVAMGTNNKASGFAATAFGAGTVASGLYASTMGFHTKASGDYSVAMGDITIASGSHSLAMGYIGTASGDYATAMGRNTIASGDQSTAMGYDNTASGSSSTAMGIFTTASGSFSTAMGSNTWASGNSSAAMGTATIAKSLASVAIGSLNDTLTGTSANTWVNTDPLVYIGNGNTSGSTRSNAVVVYKNADIDINGYTRLGKLSEAAPVIKLKKLTGTSPAVNGSIAIVHGLTAAKILSVSISMEYGLGAAETVPPFYTISPGYEYQYQVRTSDILISNKSGNSANIASMPVKILITYEE